MSVIENGVNALDLIASPPVSTETYTKAVAYLNLNYGVAAPEAKFAMLFDLIREEGWTEERFQRTFRWFIKNKPFPAWTVADWFSHGIKVYPVAWVEKQCTEHNNFFAQVDRYELPDGTFVYKPRDGQELPFTKCNTPIQCTKCGMKHFGKNHKCYFESEG